MAQKFNLEPEYGDYVEYDGHTVKLCNEDGFMKKSWEATSGLPGSKLHDEGIKNYGPITTGGYMLDPQNIESIDSDDPESQLRFGRGDWGNNRVFLMTIPESKTEQLNRGIDRGEFFFHGGKKPGSLGCIDLGSEEEDFFNTIEQYKWKLKLEVSYGF